MPKNKLQVQGFGSKNPIADNKTHSGQMMNRRVEMQFVKIED
ncbi:MAG: hypothetical protein ACK5NK_10860 [Niabella sp.]